MTLQITRVSDFDEKLLAQLVGLEKEAFGEGGLNEWSLTPLIRHGCVYVGVLDGEVIGMIQYMRDWERPKLAYMVGVSIDARLRGQGFGSELLRVSFDLLRNEGFKEVELTVDPANAAAINVYENKLGFSKAGLRLAEYGAGEDRLVMKLEL